MSAPAEERRTILALALSVVFAVTGNSMVAVALPTVGQEFDAGPARLAWIATGFTVSFAIAAAWYGRLADRFGIQACFTIGILIWGFGAGVATIGNALETVVVGRFIQGFGVGAIPTLARLAITRLIPPDRGGGAVGMVTGAIGVGVAVGPILGGLLVSAWGWRAAFGVQMAAVLLLPIIRSSVPAGGSREQKVDVVGAALLALTAGAVIAALSLMRQIGLAHPLFVGLIAAGLLCSGAVWLWAQHNPRSFSPATVLANSQLRRLSLACGLGQAASFGIIILVPQALALGSGLGPAEAGLVLLPQAAVLAVSSPTSGRLGDRLGHVPVARYGLVILGCTILAISTIGPGDAPLQVAALLAVSGIGAATFNVTLSSAAVQTVPLRQAGPAVGIFNLTFFAGGAVGVAVGSALAELPFRLNPLYQGETVGFSSALAAIALAPLLGAVILPWRASRVARLITRT
ncbi:MAG: MFS transporter [Chloroflexi bacterium]|nr:MFS transporter [Chloroflexota bacterium]